MEYEQRRRDLRIEIKCPLKPDQLCRKNEGVKESEKTLGNMATILTAECNFCGSKASGWDYP